MSATRTQSLDSISEGTKGNYIAAKCTSLLMPALQSSGGLSPATTDEAEGGSKAEADTPKTKLVLVPGGAGTVLVTGNTHAPSMNSASSRTALDIPSKPASPVAQTIASGQKHESNFGSHLPASLRTWSELHVHKPPSFAYNSNRIASRNVSNSNTVVIKEKAMMPYVLNSASASPSRTSAVPSESETARRDRQMALLHSSLKDSVLKSFLVPSSTERLPTHLFSEKQESCMPAASNPDPTVSSDNVLVKCECDYGPVDQKTLERHIMIAHVKPFSHSCELCDRKFPTRKELRDHIGCHIRTHTAAGLEEPRGVQQCSKSSNFIQEGDSLSGEKACDLPASCVAADDDARARQNTPPSNEVAAGKESHWLLRPDLVGSDCLLSFFKCTVGQCRYTANQPSDFSNHLASHSLKEMGDLVCIYCGKIFDAISVLVQHMEGSHRHMVFQCGHCLYRSVLPIHVQLHHQWAHAGQEPLLLFTCTNPVWHAALADVPTQRVSLTHYWCSAPNCDFKSFNPEVFEWHLRESHPKVGEYTCSICDSSASSPRALVQHCVTHDMDVVQCGICHHSEPTCKRMLKHLCEHHPDSPLRLICRTSQQVEEFEMCVQTFQGFAEQRASGASSAPELAELGISSSAARLDMTVACRSLPLAPAKKTCPFCPDHVVTLADLANHCVAAHQINLKISETLELMLKKHCASIAKESCLSCPFCNATFLNKDDLQEHMYCEFQYMPIQCDSCSYSTSNRTRLKEHFSSSHPEKCPVFTTSENEDFESWVTHFVTQQEARCIVVEKPYQCVHCPERFQSAEELRLHLYTHLKYYPYHCAICDECFVCQEEVEQHQRRAHSVVGQYSTKEVRFESKETKVDCLIDMATKKVQELLGKSSSQQCPWKGCSFESSIKNECAIHLMVHMSQRKTCASCQFSSYSTDVIAWHSKEQHSPVSSSTKNPSCSDIHSVPKSNSRLFACGLCSYRGPNSMCIREHSKIAHPGKAAKLVVPKRKDLHSPTIKSVEGTGKPKEEDCEQRLCISLVRPQKGVPRLTPWSLKKKQYLCSQCNFLASSEHLLHIHKVNFHAGAPRLNTNAAVIARAISNILTLAPHRYSVPASGVPHKSSQSASQVNMTTLTSGLQQTDSIHKCRKCCLKFQSRTSFFNHLVVKHCTYAVCDTCGGGLMNNAQALAHTTKKHLPLKSTFTLLRGNQQSISAARKLDSKGSNVPSTQHSSENASDVYVVTPWAPDARIPLLNFSRQHNLNARVLVNDFGKLHN
ncbi:uncharacterized protein LOC142588187 [Dermacentor variabilis]|uniref:uncharacterized protein LOC142588187 n=1 Tax=Dermacentor variabilis TaxID=34621 RepID=UPI003F5B4B8F